MTKMTKDNKPNDENLVIQELTKVITALSTAKVNKAASNSDEHKFLVGENYIIRTVTMIQIGRLEWVGDKELELSSASWIADTGRFHDAIKDGKLNEVEPFLNNVLIGRGSIVDCTVWTHKLPTTQK